MKVSPPPGYISVAEAVRLKNRGKSITNSVSEVQVRMAISRGTLRTLSVGGRRFIWVASVEAWQPRKARVKRL